MSIEALPNELLVKIFSYLNWWDWQDWCLVEQLRNQVNGWMMFDCTASSDKLRNLSLVNRRWNQVIGQRVILNVSKIHQERPELELYENICIPLEVLRGSSREYSKFRSSLKFMDLSMMSGTFGAVLEYCHQRWNMNSLHIISHYDQFILFLQHHKHLLNDVVRADISVIKTHPAGRCFDGDAPQDTHFVLPMEKLQQLNLSYSAHLFCSLSFHTPMLKILTVNQGMRTKFDLIFPESPKLRSVCFNGYRYLTRYPNNEGQTPKTTRLEFMDCSIATTLSAMFGNLQTVSLSDVTITPTDDALECLNLTKLTLRGVQLQKPLKLRVPQLHTVECDIKALQLLHLQDAFKADVLDIVLEERYIYNTQNVPVGLSSFRRLHLLLFYDYFICWLWPYLSGITELQIRSHSLDPTFHCLRNMWKHIPRLNSLGVLRIEVPKNFNFLPINVQNVSIEDCETKGRSIEFPPSVQRVRVKKLWKKMDDASIAGMILLPPNRYSPLELVREEVESGIVPIPRLTCSTKDCHDMENFSPPRIKCNNSPYIMVYTR